MGSAFMRTLKRLFLIILVFCVCYLISTAVCLFLVEGFIQTIPLMAGPVPSPETRQESLESSILKDKADSNDNLKPLGAEHRQSQQRAPLRLKRLRKIEKSVNTELQPNNQNSPAKSEHLELRRSQHSEHEQVLQSQLDRLLTQVDSQQLQIAKLQGEVNKLQSQQKPREPVLEARVHLPFPEANASIVINDVVSADVMPEYFDMSEKDMVPQYERHIEDTERIMNARVAGVKENCRLMQDPRRRGFRANAGSALLYSFPNTMAWCAVFKAGSTNWKQFFCQLYVPEAYKKSVELAKYPNETEPYCHIGVLRRYGTRRSSHARQKVSLQFLTVRHPYERLVSAYDNKLKDCDSNMFVNGRMLDILHEFRDVNGSTSEKKALLEKARLECLKPLSDRTPDPSNPYMVPMGVTWLEFIRYVVKLYTSGKGQDPHWSPASESCNVCKEDYHVIEKFETLERDHHYLFHKMGHMELLPLIAHKHDNPNDLAQRFSQARPVQDYFTSLDKTLLWYLAELYKKDFDIFGYKPHVYLAVKQKPES